MSEHSIARNSQLRAFRKKWGTHGPGLTVRMAVERPTDELFAVAAEMMAELGTILELDCSAEAVEAVD